ncbi:MAG TPA: PilZ domain-containing protein [Pyrinomonadaceae bacterium]|nr:PilZ domain-containing protein [Pyrinomonadaceae bacterium]
MITKERREKERVRADLEAHWEGVLARRDGRVVDISASGCFILTDDEVRVEELIRLEIRLPTGRRIYLWGEVVYKVEEMGFALRFTGSDEAELRMLGVLIDYARGN